MSEAIFCAILALAAAADTAGPLSGSSELRQPDSSGNYIVLPDSQRVYDRELVDPPRYNSLAAGALSALLPGAGQIYCSFEESPARRRGRIVKGGLFLAANGIAVSVLLNRVSYYRYMDQLLSDTAAARDAYAELAAVTTDTNEAAQYRKRVERLSLSYDRARFDRRQSRYVVYQAIGWQTGIYLFNVLDAVGSSRAFFNDTHKNPVLAAWLSAIPALGLGQMYNGSISKAGMVWMVQTMLLNMAYNNQRLMNDCIEQQDMLADSTNWRYAYRTGVDADYVAQWDDRYDEAFRKRNLYLWYAIFFYFYAVFDAAVDAHLHDYRRRIRMEPALDVRGEGVGFCFRLVF